MREFTIDVQFVKYEFKLLESKYELKLPESLFEILEKYAGIPIKENIFSSKLNERKLKLVYFLKFGEIYEYYEDTIEEVEIGNLGIKLMPIASEEGGWKFCISSEKNNPIYLFKTSDYGGKDAFEKIAKSFDEFINELTTPN